MATKVKDKAKKDIRIVILQRGWVMIGEYAQSGTDCKLTNGYFIRRWGTKNGLGQLAIQGPQPETKLDPAPETTFHILTTIASIKCEESKWASKIS